MSIDKGEKYKVLMRDRVTGQTMTVDAYDTIEAFKITCPAMAHAIKKLLKPGKRGNKNFDTDCDEAINSIEQSKLLQKWRDNEICNGGQVNAKSNYGIDDIPQSLYNHIKRTYK